MSVSESQADDVRIDVAALLGALKARWLRILVVTLVLLGATFTVLLFVPKLYESSASILVEQRNNAFTRIGNEQQSLGSITVAELAASQVQLIKSRDLLLSVVDELNLRDVREFSGASVSPVALILQLFGVKPEVKSGDEKVLENLGERLSVGQAGTSSVVTVSVQSTDPELAAAIANAIANAHVKRRADLSLSDTAEASGWLETEIAKLRTKVQQAENAVANYKADNDLFQTGGTGSSSILDQQLSTIATQITSAQERKNSAQSRADIILGLLKAGQPIDGVADVRNSMIIQNLVQSQATLRGELAQRSSTLLPNHPTIKALRAQIEAIDAQIGAEGRKVAGALRAEAEVEANLEQSLNDDLARLKLSVSAAARDTVTLDSLEREAKVQRDLLESYLARYSDAASRTDSSSTLPDVRVISVAAPSDTPASPKVGLVLSAVGFVAVALQVGTILFGELMTGRAVKERQFDVYSPEGEEADYEEAAPQPPVQPTRRGLLDRWKSHAPAQPAAMPVQNTPGAAEPAFDLEVAHAAAAADAAADQAREDTVALAAAPVAPAQPVAAAAMAPEPLPVSLVEPQAPPVQSAGAAALELSNLAADIAIGRVRVVLLAALSEYGDVQGVSDWLVEAALSRGLSVATIDAGSGRSTAEPGLTDLAADAVSFGDVVHKAGEGLAAVPWGQRPQLERRSMKPITLIEALGDIYEVIIVSTGRLGVSSALPIFAGVDGRLVVVSGDNHPDRAAVQSTLAEAASLGYEVGQLVSVPKHRSVA